MKKIILLFIIMLTIWCGDNRVRVKPADEFDYVTAESRKIWIEKIYLLKKLQYEQKQIDELLAKGQNDD